MAGIFHIDNKKLVELHSEKFVSEDDLQALIADFPRLIACRSDSDSESNWLLISRELRVPDGDSGANRWSLDHMFVDEDGVPILVEVKRSSDPRIRREVVGQMLDYAANAVVYLPIESIIANFEKECERLGCDPYDRISTFLNAQLEPEEFWKKVKTNLQAGRIRMLFVADEIPKELRRIIEFLNEQMDPVEVLGVEVRKYSSGSLQTIAPVVIGNTENAESRKRVIGISASEGREELVEAVNQFNQIASGKYQATGRAADYRQVRIDQFPNRMHYEFVHRYETGVTAEFHVESDKFRNVAKTLKQLASRIGIIDGARLEFDQSWSKKRGRLRLLPPQKTSPRQTAEYMLEFIEKTKESIAEAMKACD